MSKAKDFLKNPQILLKLLSTKYYFSHEDYNVLQIDGILFGKHFKFKALYIESLINSTQSECLKRMYSSSEIKARIPTLNDFYKTYQSFFCNPFLTNWHFTHLLCKHYESKAELFYMKNYYNKNDDDIASMERNAYQEDEEPSLENVINTNTIFDERLRRKIDKITEDKEVMNTLSLDNNELNSLSNSNANELYTKRSNNDSLRNIILSFAKVTYPNIKMAKEMRKYVMAKEKEKAVTKPIHFIHKSYLNKKYSKKSDSVKSMQTLIQVQKPICKLQFKKASIVSSSRISYQNASILRKINNKTFELNACKNTNSSTVHNNNSKDIKILFTKNKHTLLSSNHFNNKQTRNNRNINNSIFLNSNQQSVSISQSKSKNPNQKVFLSHCSSLTLMKTKPRCSLIKESDFLMPISLHNNDDQHHHYTNLSRNKKKDAPLQSVVLKNNPIIQLTTLSKMNLNHQKITKSLDSKEQNRAVALPQNPKVNFREFSQVKRQSLPLSYKLTKQINDILKYVKTSKSPNYKKFY